jgi:hypothetical protein
MSKHNRGRRKFKNADVIVTDRRSDATVKKDYDALETQSEVAAAGHVRATGSSWGILDARKARRRRGPPSGWAAGPCCSWARTLVTGRPPFPMGSWRSPTPPSRNYSHGPP